MHYEFFVIRIRCWNIFLISKLYKALYVIIHSIKHTFSPLTLGSTMRLRPHHRQSLHIMEWRVALYVCWCASRVDVALLLTRSGYPTICRRLWGTEWTLRVYRSLTTSPSHKKNIIKWYLSYKAILVNVLHVLQSSCISVMWIRHMQSIDHHLAYIFVSWSRLSMPNKSRRFSCVYYCLLTIMLSNPHSTNPQWYHHFSCC